MEVRIALLLITLLDGLCGKKLYLINLYTCVDEFEDYCDRIPQWTVRAAIGLANDCSDILPGYTLSTNKDHYRNRSLLLDGEVLLTAWILRNFKKDQDWISEQNHSISPIVLGSPFSFVSEYAVHILGEKQKFAQVNFRSSLTNLTNSLFYQIGPREAFFNAVRLKLLLKNNWKRVGILSSSGTSSMIAEMLEKQLVESNIMVINTASYVIQGKIDGTVWNVGQLAELKEEDVRIIITLLPMIEVPLIMCAAYDIGLIDDHHVWILPEMNLNDIRGVAKRYNMCDVDIVLRNALMVGEDYNSFENHSLPFGTNNLEDLLIKYNNLPSTISLRNVPGYNLSRVIFDATWAAILALNNSLQPLDEKNKSLEKSVNQNRVDQITSDIIKSSLNQVRFSGLSGIVDFSNESNGSLIRPFDTACILQIINNSPCTVEMYKVINETELTSVVNPTFCSYTWGNSPPTSDGLIYHPQVPDSLLIFIIVATVIFISVAMALIVFTVALRKHKYMRTSSVTFNIMIIVGCVMVFMLPLPVILTYGVRQYDISETEFIALCHANCFLDKIGFIVVNIALLLKTWRLYQIKQNKLLKMKIRFISRKAIFIFAMIMLFPVVLLLLIQLIIDRPKFDSELMEVEGRYPYKYIEHAYCNQTWWILWETLYNAYIIAIVVCIFWQAGHVSQMIIKKLALEGDTSVRLLMALIIITFCHIFIIVIFLFAGNYYVAVIVHILGSMTYPVMTITMIFAPKVYMVIKHYQEPTDNGARRKCSNSTEIASL